MTTRLLAALPAGAASRVVPKADPAQWTTSGPYADDATAVAASPAFDSDHTVFMGVSYRVNVAQPTMQATAAVLRSPDGGAT